jgi:hypothetical protein
MNEKEIEEKRKILTECLRSEFDVYTLNLPWKNYMKRNLYLSGKKIYQSEDPIADLAGNLIEMLRLK